jgi:3-hydroxyacyl-CoA dehydrogenase
MIKAEDIKKIAVIGAGLIGNSWTVNFIWKGYKVNLWFHTESKIKEVSQQIKEYLETMALHNVFKKEEIPRMMGLINFTISLEDAVKDVEFIQECVREDLEMKQKLLAEIDKFADPEAIFASSSSKLLISDIVEHSKYSKRCISGHPYTPPHLIPLVEISKPKGEKGSIKTAEIAAEFYRLINKEPIILKKDVSGYIANQIQGALLSKCAEIIQNGVCTLEDIDKAVSFGPGLRWAIVGPYLVGQLGGGDGGIKGLWTQVGGLKNTPYLDFIQAEVDKEMSNRSPEFGNDNESLRKFRDHMLIEMLKIHKKI